MSGEGNHTWHDTNQALLVEALRTLRRMLEKHIGNIQGGPEGDKLDDPAPQDFPGAGYAGSIPSALESLTRHFGLSSFERTLLLSCAGVELQSDFAALCAAAQGDPRRVFPTFSLALSAFPEAHWSALSPEAPLRRWRLIEVGEGESLAVSPLRIDERVLHYLTGVRYLDPRLEGLGYFVGSKDDLVPSHRRVAERLAAAWSRAAKASPSPVVQLCGEEGSALRAVGASACALLGLSLFAMSVQGMPLEPRELTTLMRLWEREAALSGSALLLECSDLDPGDLAREHAVARLMENLSGMIILASRERRLTRDRAMITFDLARPSTGEKQDLWAGALGPARERLNGVTARLAGQFNLGLQAIRAAWSEALDGWAPGEEAPATEMENRLWDACRLYCRARLDNLAQRVDPAAGWEGLVLPGAQKSTLREIAVQVRQRARVYESWGFESKGSRGLGISALFTGASGTGKTMAAEVLANELRLDLYRIDLSQVVSKYIGETEKNLRRVFEAAEGGGAILLFDEADALFGKRSEVKDSHDRYANIEISYLLQRMENYRGLAILTTNMKSALDSAFLRRLRFVVHFPFPDAGSRAEIWRGIFPSETPTEGLKVELLARLNVAGGSIRNIALHAAFLAAETGGPVRMGHLLSAARAECVKLEKPLSEGETGGWV